MVEYRHLPNNGEKISTIGIGTGNFLQTNPQEIKNIVNYGIDNGINFIDSILHVDTAKALGDAIKPKRDKVILQSHFGCVFRNGAYTISRDLPEMIHTLDEELELYGTDYTDIGLIHYIDDKEDLRNVMDNGIYKTLLEMKEEGKIHYLGFISHTPSICKQLIDEGDFDLFMLSINPVYDFEPSENGLKLNKERMDLYNECEKRGIGITVMKPFDGGRLLDSKESPFKTSMTPNQCIQYILDRPAVHTCLPGIISLNQFKEVLEYYESNSKEKDYSFIGDLERKDINNLCLYCNHCQPCSSNIDIASVNKYYELSLKGDELAKSHYLDLIKHSSDCIECGDCEKRCPFNVEIIDKMKKINEYFKI